MNELPQTTEAEPEETTSFDIDYTKAIEAIPRPLRIVVERLGWKLKHEGLSLDEACLMCNVDPQWLEKKIIEHPVIARALKKKELEYTTTLLKPLRKRALNDDKMALYLYELKNPKVKGKNKDDGDDAGDMLAAAVTHIQEHGDSTPLVSRTSGTAIVIGKGGGAKRLMDTIQRLIPGKELA